MDGTDRRPGPVRVPAHLKGAPPPVRQAMAPGACPRCGGAGSALMRSELVQYLLCGGCGRVWVERRQEERRGSGPDEDSVMSLRTRLAVAVAQLARFMRDQRA